MLLAAWMSACGGADEDGGSALAEPSSANSVPDAGVSSAQTSITAPANDRDDGVTLPPAQESVLSAPGACTNDADRALLATTSVAELSCQGAACVARNLEIGLGASIDREGTSACLAAQAPLLKALSADCRACFLEISLCAPQSCVSLLGGASNACFGDGLPNSDFAACSAPNKPSAACDSCQAPCRAAFVKCSGLPG